MPLQIPLCFGTAFLMKELNQEIVLDVAVQGTQMADAFHSLDQILHSSIFHHGYLLLVILDSETKWFR